MSDLSPKEDNQFNLTESNPSLQQDEDSPLRSLKRKLSQEDQVIKQSRFVPSRLKDTLRHNLVFSSLPVSRSNTPPVDESRPSTPLTQAVESQDPRYLLNIVKNLMRTRHGSVLTRNTILKMDHFEKGMNTKLDFHLQGAPNFRIAELDVYGVAQPTTIGLSTVLALLNCHPNSNVKASCTWFLTREEPLIYLNGNPYVLRNYADPLQNMAAFLGINTSRLEKLEERLKQDVIKEAKTMGGLILVHQELADGTIVPCFIAADQVQTPKELFEEFQKLNYRLKYFRIPICPEQAPEDNYFDEYVRIIKSLKPTDPLIFNCGMGVVRTTVGIVIAQIIRRTQLLELNAPDPFPISGYNYTDMSSVNTSSKVSSLKALTSDLVKGWEEVDTIQFQNHALLRLVYILEQGLNSKMSPRSAIEWALERGSLIENLKEAIMGNYNVITSLTAVLDSGDFSKKMLDEIIDKSDAVINLREDILMNRIKQTTQQSSGHESKNSYIFKAAAGLQRYYSLLCFAAYINESPDTNFNTKFSDWLKSRTEIFTMLQTIRRKSPKLYLFRPVEDLHRLSHTSIYSASLDSHYRHHALGFGPGMFEMTGVGSQLGSIAPELEEFILKSRTGLVLTSQTILKIDFWSAASQLDVEEYNQLQKYPTPGDVNTEEDDCANTMKRPQRHHVFFVEGGSNFRRIKHTHIYGIAQPTVDGLRTVLRRLLTDQPKNEKIQWINLREEPIIYINGIPYVLRDRYFTLRNIKVYKGITGSRLEQLEDRLKQDVLREINNYDGRILLHGEDNDGNVLAAWEDVDVNDVMTVREVMESVAAEVAEEFDSGYSSSDFSEAISKKNYKNILDYHRVPITAEKAPEWCDFDDIRNLVTSTDLSKTALIMNCQVGLGRSTLGTIIATLVTRWIKPTSHTCRDNSYRNKCKYLNYQIINSLLRVIKNGLEVKHLVDDVIDTCGAFLNLREMIESEHIKFENENDEAKKKVHIKRGIAALHRYFVLLCFEAYLESTSPESMSDTETFESWLNRHSEIGTLLAEFNDLNEGLIVPVEKSIGDGVALSSEIMSVVAKRHGQVLAQQTIMKHDAFPGCQKMSLKEKIEGAYNFRRVPVKDVKSSVKEPNKAADVSGLAADLERSDDEQLTPPYICGCAMPSKDAIRAVLKSMNAGPGGKRKVLWTCLREEPVLYVNKQPYVLRLFQEPLKNLESTGIITERVELMEDRMKLDALNEWKEYEGRLLLHDEKPNDKGEYKLMGMWETINREDIETPKETFQSIIDEGYQVDYLRIPITDEQAPIPDVFDQLIRRTKNANTGVDVLYNCQMGRGRTTTGMVTACLTAMVMNNENLLVNESGIIVFDSLNKLNDEKSLTYNSENEESMEESYHNGEFKIILQLISVLTYGKLAKCLTDKAINMCDHMQNLRKAIYDYKLRMDAIEDRKSKQYKAIREVALNYLIRYFYLIVFANYLLEQLAFSKLEKQMNSNEGNHEEEGEAICDDGMDKAATFKQWLDNRREITNILKLQSIEFD
ncbi:inositol hexakisphosphate-domain-containing protein [Cokeromyces recurvatus]|uniref:inositol hexakisphosphate-domain-containing protein n=1 Tax=Cokeromyces recurvatus TaxID=90255 RepID=UPI00221E535D|nr:inositol hexakisphosphate-domain-containing protein [Cokeromyces recurvatus]KAI7898613.1 inositol hexakisphosphate-domain-containing protein [Cokeromyces recurvatus]